MSKFIEVKLDEWDCSKVTIGVAPGGATATVLYDRKIPIMRLAGDGLREKYVVTSFDGLKRNMKFDATTRKFLETWEGDWSLSLKVCDAVKDAKGLQKKILDIFEDIKTKTEARFKGRKVSNPINYKIIKEIVDGIEEEKGIDDTKPAYLKIKVGYTAPAGCEEEIDGKTGKKVPKIDPDVRSPKAEFFDVTRDKSKMKVEKPDVDCRTGMKAVPKFIVGIFANTQGVFITKRLLQCYYEPQAMGGGGMDEELAEMLRDPCDLVSTP